MKLLSLILVYVASSISSPIPHKTRISLTASSKESDRLSLRKHSTNKLEKRFLWLDWLKAAEGGYRGSKDKINVDVANPLGLLIPVGVDVNVLGVDVDVNVGKTAGNWTKERPDRRQLYLLHTSELMYLEYLCMYELAVYLWTHE